MVRRLPEAARRFEEKSSVGSGSRQVEGSRFKVQGSRLKVEGSKN